MASYTAYSGYSKPPQSYVGSAYNGYDEKQPQTYAEYEDSVLAEKKRIERKDRREAICCEVVALVLGFIGLIGVAAVTGLPMWKVTAFIEENIIVMETRWEGLWMNCYRQANIRMQDFYNPLLIDAQRRELGEALYIGWVTSAFLFTAGVILLCRHAPRTQDSDERIVYNPGVNLYQPAYAYQPYSYQPAYTYQPAYSAPPPGSVAYTPSQY
ncbi:claudin-8-like [Scomber scombrus]|uniref:Claudin-8-like n=1 Tax=Scomber scombrus TaxID=13677 RepID=A0AAV1PAM6_SCOSC